MIRATLPRKFWRVPSMLLVARRAICATCFPGLSPSLLELRQVAREGDSDKALTSDSAALGVPATSSALTTATEETTQSEDHVVAASSLDLALGQDVLTRSKQGGHGVRVAVARNRAALVLPEQRERVDVATADLDTTAECTADGVRDCTCATGDSSRDGLDDPKPEVLQIATDVVDEVRDCVDAVAEALDETPWETSNTINECPSRICRAIRLKTALGEEIPRKSSSAVIARRKRRTKKPPMPESTPQRASRMP